MTTWSWEEAGKQRPWSPHHSSSLTLLCELQHGGEAVSLRLSEGPGSREQRGLWSPCQSTDALDAGTGLREDSHSSCQNAWGQVGKAFQEQAGLICRKLVRRRLSGAQGRPCPRQAHPNSSPRQWKQGRLGQRGQLPASSHFPREACVGLGRAGATAW